MNRKIVISLLLLAIVGTICFWKWPRKEPGPRLVQSVYCSGTGETVSCHFPSRIKKGHSIIVMVYGRAGEKNDDGSAILTDVQLEEFEGVKVVERREICPAEQPRAEQE